MLMPIMLLLVMLRLCLQQRERGTGPHRCGFLMQVGASSVMSDHMQMLVLMVLVFVMVVVMVLVFVCCCWWWTLLAAEPLR